MPTYASCRMGGLIVVVCAALAGGCGSEDSGAVAATKTPIGLLTELARRSGRRDVDGVVALLAEDARTQGGRQWLEFADRTAASSTWTAIRAIPQGERRNLEALSGEEFLRKLDAISPQAFASLFRCNYVADFEEAGRVLVYARNDDGKVFYLGLARQEKGALQLLGEAEARKLLDALRVKLNEKLRADGATG